MDTNDSITQRYLSPRTKDLVIYFLPDPIAPTVPSASHLSLVVNKPSRMHRARGLRT